MAPSNSPPFVWVPGQGPDPGALDRMRRAFSKPNAPMGEAWFMGSKRQMYPRLAENLEALPDSVLTKALEEIASGTHAFGRYTEWVDWYHYLLPHLIERHWATTFYSPVELLVTAFMTQYPSSDSDLPYGGFRADALATLGHCIMSPWLWPNGDLDAVRCLGKWQGPSGVAGWFDAGGLLSASLFFCIKYLPRADVERWFRSVLAIPNRYWKVQLATWLVGAHAILIDDIKQPSLFLGKGACGVAWSWSHILDGRHLNGDERPMDAVPFLPQANRMSVLRVARDWAVEEVLEEVMTDPDMQDVAAEVAGMPEQFLDLYRALPSND